VQQKLSAVEGSDLMKELPDKGALDVLAMIVKAATPTDLGTALPPGVTIPGSVPGEAAEGEDAGADPEQEASDSPAPSITGTDTEVSRTSGIVMADELVIKEIHIQPEQVKLSVWANNSSAQDRLHYKLTEIGCLKNIKKGKVGGGERKKFEMIMDNTCYHATATEQAPDEGASE
jgi:hypothetical protein